MPVLGSLAMAGVVAAPMPGEPGCSAGAGWNPAPAASYPPRCFLQDSQGRQMLCVNKQTCVWMKKKTEISLTLLVHDAPDPP